MTQFQFGPFEVNSASGELFKEGKRVKLQEQPFRLLVILLENSGQIVTREEIQSRIWQPNTFVDFDSSLRVAVRKLREALEDDAENPHYVETIPKRGYRFLVPVIRPEQSTIRMPLETRAPARRAAASRSRHWPAIAAVLLILMFVTVAFRLAFRHRPVLTAKDTVVLAEFSNSTGDPVFDETLRRGMIVQLEQSPFLSLVSDERIQQVLRLMGASPNARLTPEVARNICQRTGSAAILEGSISSLGTQYVLDLRARTCSTGDLLDEEQAQAARKEDVLTALDKIASRFRTRIGESLSTVQLHDTPLAEATTPSLDALKAYSTGMKMLYSGGAGEALPFFKRAVEIDPNFAMAYAFVGRMYGDLNEAALSAESTGKAYELRDHASDREKFFITVSYYTQVTENLHKAQQACEVWTRTYPREANAHDMLAGVIYPVLGKHESAVEEARTAMDLDPDFSPSYSILAHRYQNLGRLNDAEQILQQASARKIEGPTLLLHRYDIAFLKGDQSAMENAAALSRKDPVADEWLSQHESSVLAYSGNLKAARKSAHRAMELAQQASHPESVALYQSAMAVWEGFLGNATAARQNATSALKLSNDRGVLYGAALALALAGDTSRAQQLGNDLEKRFPEDTSVEISYLPALRARIALNQRDPAKAVELLQEAIPYELSVPRTSIHANFGALYPTYMRGEAFLAQHKGAEAAAEFQRILDNRGIALSDPIGALAHLQLGRAYAIAGDKIKARSAYQDFLILWKYADPESSILREAKAEYGKLK